MVAATLTSHTAHCQHTVAELGKMYPIVVPAGNRTIVSTGARATLFYPSGGAVFPFRYGNIVPAISGCFVADNHFIIDSMGLLVAQLQYPLAYIDSTNNRYITRTSNGELEVYDRYGNSLCYGTPPDAWKLNRITTWKYQPYQRNTILTDTLGHEIVDKRGRYSVSARYMSVTTNDTAYIYSVQGRLLGKHLADDCTIFPNHMIGLQLYGLWALANERGELLTPYRFHRLEYEWHPYALEADGYKTIDTAGRIVTTGDGSGNNNLANGYTIIGYDGDVYDEKHKLIARDGTYDHAEDMGNRYLIFSTYRENEDEPHYKTYDMIAHKYVRLSVHEHLCNDVYVVSNKGHNTRWVQKNGRPLPLPEFTSIAQVNYEKIFTIKRSQRTGIINKNLFSNEEYEVTNDVIGKLDTSMRLIVPMKYLLIEKAGEEFYVGTTPDLQHKDIYSTNGKLIFSGKNTLQISHNRNTAMVITTDSAYLIDKDGILFRTNGSFPSFIHPGDNKEYSPYPPTLIALTDSNNCTTFLNLSKQPVLPTCYQLLAQRSTAMLTLKKDDSLYFLSLSGSLLFGGRGFVGHNLIVTDGLVVATTNESGNWGIVTADGRCSTGFVYDSAGKRGENEIILKQGKQYFVANNIGQCSPYPPQANPKETEQRVRQRAEQYRQKFVTIVSRDDVARPGIYNHIGLLLITPLPQCYTENAIGEQYVPVLVVQDTVKNAQIIFSQWGQRLLSLQPPPHLLVVNRYAVTALNADGKGMLYRIQDSTLAEAEPIQTDTATIHRLEGRKRGCNTCTNENLQCSFADGRPGYISNFARVTDEPYCDSITTYGHIVCVRKGSKWGLRSVLDGWRTPTIYDRVAERNGMLYVYMGGKMGLRSPGGRIAIPAVYDTIIVQKDVTLKYIVCNTDKKYCISNLKGQQISAFFDSISVNGYAPLYGLHARRNDSTFLLSIAGNGTIVAEPDLRKPVMGIEKNYAPVVAIIDKNGKKGLYSNVQREWILPATYEYITRNDDRQYIVWKRANAATKAKDTTFVVDNNGVRQLTVAGKYHPQRLSGNYWTLNGNRPPVVTNSGKMILSDTLQTVELYEPNLLKVQTDAGNYGIANTDGNMILQPVYDGIHHIGYNYWQAYRYNDTADKVQYTLIAPDGRQLTTRVYDEIVAAKNEYMDTIVPAFMVAKDGYWGLLDAKGEVLLPCNYKTILQVYRNKAVVARNKNGKYGLLSIQGKELVPFRYGDVFLFQDGRVSFEAEGKWIVADSNGNILK